MSILAAGPPRYGDDDAWDQNKVMGLGDRYGQVGSSAGVERGKARALRAAPG